MGGASGGTGEGCARRGVLQEGRARGGCEVRGVLRGSAHGDRGRCEEVAAARGAAAREGGALRCSQGPGASGGH